MIKIFELVRAPEGQDHAAFIAALTEAATLLAAVPGIAGFNVQESLPLPSRKDIKQLDIPSDVDAFIEVWAESIEAYQTALATPAGADWGKARAALLRDAKTLVLEEHAIIAVPADRPPTRNNAFLTRNASFATREEFLHEWIGGHGDMCLRVPYLKGFVPCPVIAVLPQSAVPEMPTDKVEGIAQAWFATPEDEIAMIQTPQAKEWFAHGATTFGLIKAFGARETAARIPAGETA